jgi:hypothetical protein
LKIVVVGVGVGGCGGVVVDVVAYHYFTIWLS